MFRGGTPSTKQDPTLNKNDEVLRNCNNLYNVNQSRS